MTTTPPNPPQPTAMEQWRGFINYLMMVIGSFASQGRFPPPLAALLGKRLCEIRARIERLTARIAAGTFVPRKKTGPREKKANRPPWQPGRLPTQRGWLGALLSDNDKVQMNLAPGIRGWLGQMFQNPEFLALVETAPAEMARPIRSLVWMLNFPKDEIPAILRRPRKPRAPRPKTPPPPPPPPQTAQPATETAAEKPVPISWKKPRGSISNRLYRNYKPPGSRPPKKSA